MWATNDSAPKLPNADFARRCQRMSGRNNQRQLVQINHGRSQLRLLRIVRKYAELHIVFENVVGNLSCRASAGP